MDFLKKGLEAAKKAGNKAVNQIKEAVDENNVTSVAGGGSDDAAFEDHVQRFMTLNTALRNIASKAHAMVLAIKAQGEASLCNIELLEATCELQFGEESYWTSSAITLRNFNQQVDGKINGSVRQLVQRDILDKIKAELDTNQSTKDLIDARRGNKTLGAAAADEALSRLAEIVRRRRMILAHCVTSLMSHQYNYYVRAADLARPLHQVAAECKQMLSDQTGDPDVYFDRRGGAQQEPSSNAPAGAPPDRQQEQQERQRAAASQRPPSTESTERQPQQQQQQQQQPSHSPPAPPVQQQLQERAVAPPAEADLLGIFGDDGGASGAQEARPNGAPSGAGAGQQEGDLLGSDLLGSLLQPSAAPVRPSAPRASRADTSEDLLNFGESGSKQALKRVGGAAHSHDPLSDLFGDDIPHASSSQGGGWDDMFAMPPTGGAAQTQVSKGKEDSPYDHKQDSAYHHPGVSRAGANGGASRGAAPKGENQFKGAGTNREALKAQFQAHVTAKQESAAQAVKQEVEDKKKYEDAKFAAQDEIDVKVTEWAGPKHNRKNLRAMLACFDLVTTWPRAREKWVKVGLHELVMPADVKKIHRKAILLVHPDKVVNEDMQVKILAESVHSILHEALQTFRKQENC